MITHPINTQIMLIISNKKWYNKRSTPEDDDNRLQRCLLSPFLYEAMAEYPLIQYAYMEKRINKAMMLT
jgi:hypothetical protein